MVNLLLFLATLAISYVGFACLALSLATHWRKATGESTLPSNRINTLRMIGFSALAVSFALALLRDGVSFGSLLWVLILTLSAVMTAFTFTWKPHWLALLAKAARAIH